MKHHIEIEMKFNTEILTRMKKKIKTKFLEKRYNTKAPEE